MTKGQILKTPICIYLWIIIIRKTLESSKFSNDKSKEVKEVNCSSFVRVCSVDWSWLSHADPDCTFLGFPGWFAELHHSATWSHLKAYRPLTGVQLETVTVKVVKVNKSKTTPGILFSFADPTISLASLSFPQLHNYLKFLPHLEVQGWDPLWRKGMW